jgi:hypothetical protein
MNEQPPKNWMKDWEDRQEKKQEYLADRTPTIETKNPTSETERNHVESLIRDDLVSLYYEISHGNFDSAKALLEECLEKYKNVPDSFLKEFDEIQSLIDMRDEDLKPYENGDIQ